MITLCGLDTFNKDKSLKGDFNFLIARKVMSQGLLKTFVHLPQISPSNDLLSFALSGKRNNIPWEHTYTKRFSQEMRSPQAMAVLNQLINLSKNGHNIVLVCYCSKGNFCHRYLIADILKSLDKDLNIRLL